NMIIRDFHGDVDLSFLNPSENNLVMAGIRNNFDPYYGCIPNNNEINRRINNNEILALKEDNTVGFIEISKSGKKIIIDHFLIFDEYKGKGYGKIMTQGLFKFASDNNFNTIELFVNDENENAIKMYEAMGFERTNINSIIYRRTK